MHPGVVGREDDNNIDMHVRDHDVERDIRGSIRHRLTAKGFDILYINQSINNLKNECFGTSKKLLFYDKYGTLGYG